MRVSFAILAAFSAALLAEAAPLGPSSNDAVSAPGHVARSAPSVPMVARSLGRRANSSAEQLKDKYMELKQSDPTFATKVAENARQQLQSYQGDNKPDISGIADNDTAVETLIDNFQKMYGQSNLDGLVKWLDPSSATAQKRSLNRREESTPKTTCDSKQSFVEAFDSLPATAQAGVKKALVAGNGSWDTLLANMPDTIAADACAELIKKLFNPTPAARRLRRRDTPTPVQYTDVGKDVLDPASITSEKEAAQMITDDKYSKYFEQFQATAKAYVEQWNSEVEKQGKGTKIESVKTSDGKEDPFTSLLKVWQTNFGPGFTKDGTLWPGFASAVSRPQSYINKGGLAKDTPELAQKAEEIKQGAASRRI